jgi:hypothetical protein
MIIKISGFTKSTGRNLSIKCPGCGQLGTFEPFREILDIQTPPSFWLGQRMCPNQDCRTHIFCIYEAGGKILRIYPSQRIDFDPKGIPESIVKTFTEALSCHAENIHVAAAIMIRRTLEELCENKSATGDSLKKRIAALQSKVILPKELFDALDDLRLLGNDAAHVESNTFNSIGPSEIEIAIELTKEVLKAVYQLDDLVSRLRSLKK